MIGRHVSHYRILDVLGEGGMGIVYRAEDTQLNRPVALKFLRRTFTADTDSRAQLVREARAAAALHHPNVCTIYEIGETEIAGESGLCTFIAMAYIDGETLASRLARGPLPIDTALSLACQVARGLQAAHTHGIVHRDLKSANIMVTADAEARIVDFGLARRTDGSDLTQTGAIVGTIAYMAPEQLRGETVDRRADIWSLGVILYEMLTGHLPFEAPHPAGVMYAIMNEPPPPVSSRRPESPPAIDRVMAQALAREPAQRYSSVESFLADLKALTTGPREIASPSIAVLPFVNVTPDPGVEYVTDGMTEDIIGTLARISELRVVARTSSFAFKGRAIDVRTVGRELAVATILEGSVRTSGRRIRITAQLVSVADGCHLWSERYDRDFDDAFTLQDEISRAIAAAVRVRLFDARNRSPGGTRSPRPEVYDACLKGRYHIRKRTAEDLTRSIKCFESAIAADDAYAPAYAGLADALLLLPNFVTGVDPAGYLTRAKLAADKALSLDDTLGEAHATMGLIRTFDWDWSGAEESLRRAIQLSPNDAIAHGRLALHLLSMGHVAGARAEGEIATRLDPLAPIAHCASAVICCATRRYEEAIEHCGKALELEPDFPPALATLCHVYEDQGLFEEVMRVSQRHLTLKGEEDEARMLTQAFANGGYRAVLERKLQRGLSDMETGYESPFGIAYLHALLGDHESALQWLHRGVTARDRNMPVMKWSPAFDPVRGDARFQATLAAVGLPAD